MEGVVVSLINLYPFPTGRRLYALEEVERRARERGITVVAEHAQRGIAHDRTTMAMEAASRSERHDAAEGERARASAGASKVDDATEGERARASAGASKVDNATEGERARASAGASKVDHKSCAPATTERSKEIDTQLHRAILGLDSYLDLQVRVFSADSARGHAATVLRQVLLPMGAGAMLQLPIPEELVEVDELIDRLDFMPEAADAKAALPDIEPIVGRIKELVGQYRMKLDGKGRAVSPEQLCEARIRGQRLLSETVALILSHFAINAPNDDTGRNYLLEPILQQNQIMREARRRRRQPTDIDPATGLEESPTLFDSSMDTPTLDLRRPAA